MEFVREAQEPPLHTVIIAVSRFLQNVGEGFNPPATQCDIVTRQPKQKTAPSKEGAVCFYSAQVGRDSRRMDLPWWGKVRQQL